MKKILKYLVVALIFIPVMSCKKESKIILKFTNPLNIERKGEVISIEYNDLTNFTGEFPLNQLPLFIDGHDTLTVQFIDKDNNNYPEEILIEADLGPDETKDIYLTFVSRDNYPQFPQKTNLRFAALSDTNTELLYASRVQTVDTEVTSKVYQMEGPAWENDKVGFRNYFDLRNGMDIFGKRTTEMVLNKVGLGDNYHELSDWGMDILKVGNSLGSGAIGIERNNKLYRIGDNGKGTIERFYQGPLKTEFAFIFPDWKLESDSIYINHYISITAGQYAYKSTVFAQGLAESDFIISGIVNMLSDELFVEKSGNHNILFTHSIQAEDSKKLAMALIIPEKYFKGEKEAPKAGNGIIDTYYARMNLNGQKEAEFYFYALWETSDNRFADTGYVREFLKSEAQKLNNPIIISGIR